MGLLGTFIHNVAGNTLTAPTATTYNHSLGQQPDLVLPHVTSLAATSVYGEMTAYGANASLATVVAYAPSCGATAAVAFDLWVIYFWSAIR